MFSAKIIGIGEKDCGAYNPNGIHIEDLFTYLVKAGTFQGAPNVDIIDDTLKV